jgi:hypothetical protein
MSIQTIGPDPTQGGQAAIYVKQQPVATPVAGAPVKTEEVTDVQGVQSMYGDNNLNGLWLPAKVIYTITPGGGGSNLTNVLIQVVSNQGRACAFPWDFDMFLSDSPAGVGLTATTASGAVAPSTGTLIQTYTAKKALYVQTDGTGTINLQITDAAKTGFYIICQTPGAFPTVSRQLVAGDYG